MNKPLTALALAAVLSPVAFADSALEVYGKATLTVQNTDDDLQGGDKWETKSNGSRLGFKGDWSLSASTAAFYQYEFEVDVTDADNAGHFKARNQAVGLRGDFGQVLTGRWDTPVKMLQTKVDVFNDLDPETKYIFGGKKRANNTVAYGSPAFGGFKFNVATLLQETVDTNATGDEDKDGLFDATSLSGEYTLGNLWLGLGMDNNINIYNGNYLDGAKTTRVSAQYKMAQWTFGAMWQNHDDDAGYDGDSIMANASLKVSENGKVKLQLVKGDGYVVFGATPALVEADTDQLAMGYDHTVAKNVMLFAFYNKVDMDNGNDTASRNQIAGGIEVKF